MRALKIATGIAAALVCGVAAAFVAARFHDGPFGAIPGGPLEAGDLVSTPVSDWSFAEPVETIELQLADEGTSRTTWILVREGRAYVPCSLGFPPGKSWHFRADGDGRAVIRVLGKRYPVRLERLEEPDVERELVGIAAAKYPTRPPTGAGVWFFAVESRQTGS